MLSFSLPRTQPKGQNSHTCKLTRRDSGFPDGRPGLSLLHTRVQEDFYFCRISSAGQVPLKSQRGARCPPEITGQCQLSPSAEEGLSSQKGHSGQQRQHRVTGTGRYFLSIWQFKKRTAIFKIKTYTYIYKKHEKISISHQQLITVHAVRA